MTRDSEDILQRAHSGKVKVKEEVTAADSSSKSKHTDKSDVGKVSKHSSNSRSSRKSRDSSGDRYFNSRQSKSRYRHGSKPYSFGNVSRSSNEDILQPEGVEK